MQWILKHSWKSFRYILKASAESCLESNNIIRFDLYVQKNVYSENGLVKQLGLKYVKKISPPVGKLLESGRPH